MRFKHRKNKTSGLLDLGGKRVPINEDGTFVVPDDTSPETIARLKTIGHIPVNDEKVSKPKTPEPKPKPPVEEDGLENMPRTELWRLAKDMGITDICWSGKDADTSETLIEKIRKARK